MFFHSTRGKDHDKSFASILMQGLAEDGGLFMPEEWTEYNLSDLHEMKHLSYAQISAKIMKPFV